MRTIVVAPHPDDETLGAGGTLLRRKAEGGAVAWLIVTSISEENGWSAEKVKQRQGEIDKIAELYSFDEIYSLNFPTTRLDTIPMSDLIAAMSAVFEVFVPNEVFVPHASDVHTDHRIVFDAVAGCTKWFRHPSVKRVLAYETLSETDFALCLGPRFCPTVFMDIEPFLEAKLQAMNIYASELGRHPFPRSFDAIRALAAIRGAASGFVAAEAFELLRERA
jgi:LmbE family N-acetylglucosaminyl deacetylase